MIVGFTGKLGSGKDTAALRLGEIIDLPYQRISFADKLKDSFAALFDLPREVFEENKNNPQAFITVSVGFNGEAMTDYEVINIPNVLKWMTFREGLQRYGTESHRDIFGDNFWVEQALSGTVADYNDKLYVVTDVRFPNELARVQELGGIVVRVKGLNEETGTHASEQVLEGVDWEIDNTQRGDNFSWLDSQLRHMVRMHWSNAYAPMKATTSGESEENLLGSRIVTLGAERIRT